VHITGEVNEPGVYSLPEGATVLDAIQAASGETEKSAAEALNLAAVLTDGQRIYIPSNEDTAQTFETEQRSSEIISTSLVNINTATKSELEALPGIGPVLAQAIIDYRTNNGFFLAEEDLIKVSGIGNVLFQSLQELITVSP
jgi:competence protein ComEA